MCGIYLYKQFVSYYVLYTSCTISRTIDRDRRGNLFVDIHCTFMSIDS